MAYAFLTHIYGSEDEGVINTMNGIEYAPHTDPHWDPFSIVYKVSIQEICSWRGLSFLRGRLPLTNRWNACFWDIMD